MQIEEFKTKLDDGILSMPDFVKQTEFEPRISSAGDCVKLMWYQKRFGKKPITAQKAFRMGRGTYLHKMFLDIFTHTFGSDFVGAEEECIATIGSVVLPGHPDGEFISLDAVYEFKTVSDSTFAMVTNQGHPIPAHYEQANLYAHAKARSQILFHYFNVNDGESLFYLLAYNADQAVQTAKKFIDSDDPDLKRPYHDPTQSPCWFCDYKEECYEGFASQVAGGGRAEVTDVVPVVSARELAIANKTRLENEKLEKLYKKQLSDYLIPRSINEAKIIGLNTNYLVTVSLGANSNPLVKLKEIK